MLCSPSIIIGCGGGVASGHVRRVEATDLKFGVDDASRGQMDVGLG